MQTSKYPEHYRAPEPTSVPFKVPEPTGDYLLGDQYAREELQQVDEPAINAMALAHKRYREGFQKLRTAMEARDPNETEAAHLKSSKQIADKWLKQAARQSDEARERAKSALTAVKLDIRDKLQLDETPRAGEVRAVLRDMKPEERLQAVNQAIERGDSEVMAAVVNGSPLLSGVSDEDRDAMHEVFVRRHAPELVQKQKALELALEINSQTNLEALENYSRIFDRGRMEGINRAAQKAQAARAAVLED